jgi:F-type H+-transporting ATPase subunit delta
MASGKKYIQQFARNLYNLSFADGTLSPERVGGALAYVEKHRPARTLLILKAYHRLVAAEVARRRAVVAHAGPITDTSLQQIAASMTRKYGRPISAVPERDDSLLAGLRVRVGDDVYEYSVAGQLASLAGAGV